MPHSMQMPNRTGLGFLARVYLRLSAPFRQNVAEELRIILLRRRTHTRKHNCQGLQYVVRFDCAQGIHGAPRMSSSHPVTVSRMSGSQERTMTNPIRAAERCARRATELLMASDVLLTDQPGDPLIETLLATLEPALRTAIQVITLPAPAAMPTLCIITALTAACDGSLVVPASATACAAYTAERCIPCYALLAGGPDPDVPTGSLLRIGIGQALLEPSAIAAVITDKALYRPDMLQRYLSDSDAPLDVIPLVH